jgi:hypothetical protein
MISALELKKSLIGLMGTTRLLKETELKKLIDMS